MSEELKPNMTIDEARTFADENGGKTGYQPGMLQDDSRALSRALASKPDAKLNAREAAAAIAKERAQRDTDDLREALANAHNALELYHAYGWPDRGGVRAALRVQIDALAAAQQPADIHDLDRVLRLADEHAEDSHEDGTRVLDRGGLLAFAKDVLRIFGPAPSAPEQQSALGYNDALRIARGCTDYSGGYRFDPSRYTAFQDGVGTVINALTHAQERGLADHQIRALHGMGCEQPSAAVEAAEWQPDFEHLANEWADAATNGPSWLANVRDGICTFDEALAGMRRDFEHCRKVGARVRAAAPPEPLRVGALTEAEAKVLLNNFARACSFGDDAQERKRTADLIIERLLATQPTSAAAVVPDTIARIIESLHTQDNRITESPLFAVQQRRRIYGIDDGYCDNAEWELDGETWTPEDGEDPPAGAQKVGYTDIWEFVTGCLTEQGCKDFITINGHNLHEPRIYAYGSYRNAEFIELRKWLMSLRATTPKGKQ